MLVVTVMLVPGGDRSRAQEIASASITNTSDLADLSNYAVIASERGSDVTGLPDQTVGFEIEGHDRRQSVWSLVAKAALHAAGQINRRGRRAA